MAVSDTLIDTLFDGRYRIVRKLGAGGMANVYLAEDQELGRRVAIKILNERHANDEQFVERFRREAKSAAALSHPNIVSIYDRGEAEGTYYIAMEHLDGRTLKELIVARGPAPVHVAIDYARQILAALRFAHRHGIVHRDIKPHNVLVDGEGRAKVADFGIARAGASQMTEAGSIVGTAQYLSPEQARGAPVDNRSDLYSMGVVLFELLTGRVPFTGDSPVEIAMKHLSETPPPPSAKRPEIPRELDLVVTRALAKDPAHRYQTAEEMDLDLDRVARGLGVTNRTEEAATSILTAPTTMPTTISRPPAPAQERPGAPAPAPVYYEYDEPPRRRRPLWPWLLPLLLVVATAAAGWLVYQQIQDQFAATRPVEVPAVEGLRRVQATQLIRDAGLVPRVTYDFSDEVPVGRVISQDPAAREPRERGSGVRIVVSYGRQQVEVPTLRGRSVTEAVAALTALGLEHETAEQHSDQPAGTVIGQRPQAGTRVARGTTVTITVSSGPETIQVPSVVGQSYEAASSALHARGFAVRRVDVDSNQPAGTVVEQDPAGGEFAPVTSSVTLSVSRGPQTTAVPNVEGETRDDAVQTLLDAGFRPRVQQEDTTNPDLAGTVLSQSPGPNTQARPNTPVVITVGRFVEPEVPQVPTAPEELP
jgi:eukaryotic-like serine/threonine-protein kinase